MLNTRKLKVTDLNPHLICVLCGGYYIDATTIIECLHSFCRSCIVRYLESNKYCPICDVQVHKTRPLQNIRPDPTLQTIVYKLVPGLYQNEMRCRREFYAKHPEAKLQVQNPEARGELTDQSSIFLPDDQISICLEYMDSSESQQGTYGRRYLRCPAAVTVLHLHKLIRAKFGLTSHKVDVMYKEDILLDNWTLMDVAYIYQWRRKCPIHLTYRILEIRRKRVSLPIENAQSTVDESTAAKTPRKENDTSVSTTTEGSSATKSAGDSKKLPTYQLRISENGVMSVTGIENANRLLAPPQLVNVDDFESSVVKETITNKKNSLESTKDTEVENTTANVSKSIPTSNSSSLTTSTPTSSKSSSSTSITTSTSTPSSSIKAQAVTTFEVGDNRTRISESVNSTSSPKTATKPCSDKSLVQIQTSNVEQNKPKDNNNVRNVKTANRPAVDSNNIGKTNIPVKAEANARDSISQSKTEASIKSDSVCNSNKNTSRAETPKEDVSTKASKDLSSNLVDIFPCEPPRPSNSFKVYPGVKSISTPITAPLAKDDPAKQNFQKTNAVAHPKPTPMEILNAAVPQKAPNSTNKYKTLKSPSKSWNPTMPRSTILSMKHPQAAVNQSKDPSSTTVSDVAHPPPAKQPKFFKLRNMPRFLGNPASGVKPMFQVAPGSEVVSQSPSTSANTTPSAHKSAKTTNSSITLMKIDPKTLCPIPVNPVSHVLSSPPKTTSSPPPKKLPPPYTPGSPKTTNHYSNSRTNASASKAPVPRIPSPAHTGALIPSNPFMPSVAHNNAHLLYNAFPTPFSATDPSASRLLPGAPNTELIRAMSALCSSGAAYHPSLPPSISMLFNPHHPHHRLTQVDRAAFKSLTEDKTPSPPAVQRIPPSNALGSKSNSDLAQATNSTSSSTSQNNSTKKEKVESDSKTKTSPTTTVQPKKIESGVSRQSSPPPCEPITTHADSKAAPPAEKSTDSKTNSETNPPSKTKSLDAKVNHVDNNSESKPAPSKDTEKVKSNININSISCKAKVEKSPVHEKQVDSSNMKEKKEIPKNNNYTNKAASFTEGSKGNIMITTESSLKV